MDSVDTEEGWLTTFDGLKLYTKTWKTVNQPTARLVFLHGFSDHCNWYTVLFNSLAQKGIEVYSFDQRGWGRSVHEKKHKGLTGPTSQVMDDITAFIKSLPAGENVAPLFLMGHSMGGGEALYYACTGPNETVSKIRGFLLESPLIAMHPATAPAKALVVTGSLAAKVLPHWPMVNKLDPKLISRDPEVCQGWSDDPLNHDTGTLQGLAAMLARSADMNEGRVALQEGRGDGGKTRLWIGHGTADSITSYDASRRFYDRTFIDDKEFRIYEGWYHKLHSEPGDDKAVFANDTAKWILGRSGTLPLLNNESPKPKL